MRCERLIDPICMGSKRVGDMVGGGGVDCFLLYNLEEKKDDVGKRREVQWEKEGYM